jgi:hypothetical protein
MIVCRIVAVVTIRGHLIGKPPVDAFIEVRWLDFDEPAAQKNCQDENGNFGKRGS